MRNPHLGLLLAVFTLGCNSPSSDLSSAKTAPTVPAPAPKTASVAPQGALSATLIVNRDHYSLTPSLADPLTQATLQGLTNSKEDWVTAKRFATPAVDLRFQITNTSSTPMNLLVDSDRNKIGLSLSGPSVIAQQFNTACPEIYFMGRWVHLEPGESHDIALTGLTYGDRCKPGRAYWLAPGEYELTMNFQAAVLAGDLPTGSDHPRGDAITLRAPAVTLTVSP